MAEPDRVLHLAPGVREDDVEDALATLGLRLQNVVVGADGMPAQRIYVSPDRGSLVHFVDDPRVASRFLVLRGAASALEAAFGERFAVAPPEGA